MAFTVGWQLSWSRSFYAEWWVAGSCVCTGAEPAGASVPAQDDDVTPADTSRMTLNDDDTGHYSRQPEASDDSERSDANDSDAGQQLTGMQAGLTGTISIQET